MAGGPAQAVSGGPAQLQPEPEVPRGPFSQSCTAFPGKRVVLVSVSQDYLQMFNNWLHFAGQWIQDTEQLVVVAEDEDVAKTLRKMKDGAGHPQFKVFVSSHPIGSSHKSTSNLRQGSLDPQAPLYNSQAFGDLVTQRATHMLAYLEKGCTVLYSDIDNVWLQDPFKQIAHYPQKDLIATDDEPQNKTQTYVCTCFLYVQPTQASFDLMHAWHDRTVGQATNQRPFNQVLQEKRDTYMGSLTEAVLPFSEFPPGLNASQFPHATVIHANWIHGGLPKKIEFLQERGLWYVGSQSDGKAATQDNQQNATHAHPESHLDANSLAQSRLVQLLLDNGTRSWNLTADEQHSGSSPDTPVW